MKNRKDIIYIVKQDLTRYKQDSYQFKYKSYVMKLKILEFTSLSSTDILHMFTVGYNGKKRTIFLHN